MRICRKRYLDYFKIMRMNNLLILGTIFKEKASSYAQELQVEEFHAPNGYYEYSHPENCYLDYSHQTTPTQKFPIQDNSHLDDYQPETSHPGYL